MDFDEEFSGAAIEGAGEEALIPSAPVNKGPKPKREKKEPGEEPLQFFVCEKMCMFRALIDAFDCGFFLVVELISSVLTSITL